MALTLKDHLHLDPADADIILPIHRLIDAELSLHPRSAARIVRSKSKNALAKISALFKSLPFSSSDDRRNPEAGGGFLRRSLSKGGNFWKKKAGEAESETMSRVRIRVRDIVRERSFGEGRWRFSSSSSESESDGSDSFVCSVGSSGSFDLEGVGEGKKCPNFSPQSNWGKNVDCNATSYSVNVENKEEKEMVECGSENEEQLSPVSVMDFPSENEDEEEETTTFSNSSSPSFHQTLKNIERSKLELLEKIRRFESLAELNAINLDRCFENLDDSCSSSTNAEPVVLEPDDDLESMEAHKAWTLLEELKAQNHSAVGPKQGSFEKLLVDFFIEGLSHNNETNQDCCSRLSKKFGSRSDCQTREEILLNKAKCWIEGDVEDENEEALTWGMEKNGEFTCSNEEVNRLVMDLEGILFGLLLEEVLVDITCFEHFGY